MMLGDKFPLAKNHHEITDTNRHHQTRLSATFVFPAVKFRHPPPAANMCMQMEWEWEIVNITMD